LQTIDMRLGDRLVLRPIADKPVPAVVPPPGPPPGPPKKPI
jgi:hypothetical protein